MKQKNEKEKSKEKYPYIFGQKLSKIMGKIDMRTQLESSMLSMFLLLIGLSIMVLYMVFFSDGGIAYKIIIVFNMLCGWLLIGANLITAKAQYDSYMEAMNINPEEEKQTVRARGNIFKRIKLARQLKKKKKRLKKMRDRMEFHQEVNKEDIL